MNRVQAIVIGAGQAGLSVGHHLARWGVSCVILDSRARVGDGWRSRWDSLRLLTPARENGLAGMPFPAARRSCPTKDEMASYLEQYAERFALRVYGGMAVDRVWWEHDRYVVTANRTRFEAEHVVVAMASGQRPRVPSMVLQVDSGIVQLHSSAYRNPAQLQPGGALVVGAGHSGTEIAAELSRGGYRTWLSGDAPSRGRTTPGVERVPRTVRVCDGVPVMDDGRRVRVANIVWCTGFEADFSWIDAPLFGHDGEPNHHRGIVTTQPGLYYVGLAFRRDAAHVAMTIAKRVGAMPAGTPALHSAWW